MKFKRLTLLGALLAAALRPVLAEEISVNARTLEGWTIEGTKPDPLPGTEGFTLPTSVRISRLIPGSPLTVHLATQPTFGADASETPILEIGSVALAFVRLSEGGRIILLGSDGGSQTLGQSIALDAQGKALEPLQLDLVRRDRAVVVMHGAEKALAEIDSATSGSEVALSSGTAQSWSIAQLILTVPDAETAVPAKSQSATSADAVTLTAEPSKIRYSTGNAATSDGTGDKAADTGRNQAVQRVTRALEIYTPASVRSETQRAIVETSASTQK